MIFLKLLNKKKNKMLINEINSYDFSQSKVGFFI